MLNTGSNGIRRLLTLDLTDTVFSFRKPSGNIYLNHAIAHLRSNSNKNLKNNTAAAMYYYNNNHNHHNHNHNHNTYNTYNNYNNYNNNNDIYNNGQVGNYYWPRRYNNTSTSNNTTTMTKMMMDNNNNNNNNTNWLSYLSSKTFEERIQKSFMTAYKKVEDMWPNFGFCHHISSQQWWTTVILNTFHQLQMIAVNPLSFRVYCRLDHNNNTLIIPDWNQLQSIKLVVPGSISSAKEQICNPSAPFVDICNDIFKEFSCKDAYRVFEDVVPFLKSIKSKQNSSRNIPIGCISNATSEYRERVLPDLGLEQYIDFTLLSKDIGVEKPDPTIFKYALQIAKETPYTSSASSHNCVDANINNINTTTINNNNNNNNNNSSDSNNPFSSSTTWKAVHVGNDLEKDVFGALQMGWTACWIIRNNPSSNYHLRQQILEKGNEYWKTHHREYHLVNEDQWNHILQQNVHIIHDLKVVQELGLL